MVVPGLDPGINPTTQTHFLIIPAIDAGKMTGSSPVMTRD